MDNFAFSKLASYRTSTLLVMLWGNICISFSLQSSNTCILASSIVITHNHFLLTEKENDIQHNQTRKLQISGTNRICNQKETTTSFLYALHPIILFLPFNFFLLHSVYSLLPLFSLFFFFLYLCLLFLRLWLEKLFLLGILTFYSSQLLQCHHDPLDILSQPSELTQFLQLPQNLRFPLHVRLLFSLPCF